MVWWYDLWMGGVQKWYPEFYMRYSIKQGLLNIVLGYDALLLDHSRFIIRPWKSKETTNKQILITKIIIVTKSVQNNSDSWLTWLWILLVYWCVNVHVGLGVKMWEIVSALIEIVTIARGLSIAIYKDSVPWPLYTYTVIVWTLICWD